MNARVTVPTQVSRFVSRWIIFILLLSVLVILMNHAKPSLSMPSVMNHSGPVLVSANPMKPRAVPVPTPPARTAVSPASATPVPVANQPVPVPQPVPTPPAGR